MKLMERDFVYDPTLALYLPLWKKDGASFRSDDRHGHLCTRTGALWRPDGYSFDGDDWIDCSSSSVLNITDVITVFMWFKMADDANYNYVLLAKTANVAILRLRSGHGSPLRISWKLGATESNSSAQVVAGNWYSLAVTFNNAVATGNKKIYLNGKLDIAYTQAGNMPDTAGSPLYIGKNTAAWANHNGSVGEVAIWRRESSPHEILALHESTKGRYQ
jgi:hypothetical protein